MTDEIDTDDLERRMKGAMDSLRQEFASLRTGRASASMVEPIMVDAYGSPTPINQVGTVNVPEPRMVTINVWDKAMVGKVEKAIRDSDLGLNPASQGEIIRVPMPALTEERRKELIKVVKHEGEGAKVAVRNLRRDANAHLKDALKAKTISEDEERRAQDDVQKLTDKAIVEIDKVLAQKEQELMQI